ncbi:transposase [Psychromonas aquimarina]|uniref:transposase n=1 Tax=Psychromonas aquimarina TaxID=444919 RepID=UPI00042616C6|nr:transposase [Psychromonas aquimarina]
MPKYNNPRRTWKYSNDFKVNAVQLSFVVGITIKSVAEKLDIHPFMLSRWRKEYREGIIVADKRKKVAVNKFTLRGQEKVNAQWQMYCLIHNIEKLRASLH